MKKIPLTQGYWAVIDDCDFIKVAALKWHALKLKRGVAACTMVGKKPLRKRIYMHRYILGVIDSKIFVDHKDHDPLNNCNDNLRLATPAQNRHNSRANNEVKTSKYLGVSFDRRDKIWVAQVAVNGKQVKIGRSKNEKYAAIIYNDAAIRYYGEFAHLNIIE